MIKQKPILLLSLLALLAACNGTEVKETLGLTRNAPDEFRVVSRPPLSMPPDFALRPPTPGAESAHLPAREAAEDLVLGRKPLPSLDSAKQGSADTAVGVVTSSPLATTGESQLLLRAGAEKADPSVREKMQQENMRAVEQEEEKGWIDSVRDTLPALSDSKKKDPVVDAAKERERIQSKRKENEPITGEGVEEVKPDTTGLLNKILK